MRRRSSKNRMNLFGDKKVSDEKLLRAFARGNADAFEVLYRRHKQAVYHFLFRQMDKHSVCEELAQDAWMAVIRQAGQYENSARFKTWLFRIAHNKLIDYWRRQKHRSKVSVVDEIDQLAVTQDRSDESLQLKELSKQLNELAPEQLSTLLLKIEGFSYNEIADITEAKKETVKSRLRYATKHLRLSMEAAL